VIRLVDSSFVSNADDALVAVSLHSTDFCGLQFLGRTRNNVTLYRQTLFTLGLMNGNPVRRRRRSPNEPDAGNRSGNTT